MHSFKLFFSYAKVKDFAVTGILTILKAWAATDTGRDDPVTDPAGVDVFVTWNTRLALPVFVTLTSITDVFPRTSFSE